MSDGCVLTKSEYDLFIKIARDYLGGGEVAPLTAKKNRGGFPLVSNKLRLAIAQENAQTDGTLSVKFMNRSGAETGDAFDIYIFNDKAETDYSDYILALTGATVATDNKLWIKKGIDGSWYLDDVLIKFESITIVTDVGVNQTANKHIDKKTRATVKVLATAAESAWTSVHTGGDCP